MAVLSVQVQSPATVRCVYAPAFCLIFACLFIIYDNDSYSLLKILKDVFKLKTLKCWTSCLMHCYTIMSYLYWSFDFWGININRQSYLHCSTVFNFLRINCFFSCYCLFTTSTRELRFDWPLVWDLLFWTHWQCNRLPVWVCLFLYSLVSTVFLLNHKDMAVPIDFFTSVPFCRERKFQKGNMEIIWAVKL